MVNFGLILIVLLIVESDFCFIIQNCDIFSVSENFTIGSIHSEMGILQTVYNGDNGCYSTGYMEKVYKRAETCLCTPLCCEFLKIEEDKKEITFRYYPDERSCVLSTNEFGSMRTSQSTSKCYYDNLTTESYYFKVTNSSSSWNTEINRGDEDYFFVKKLYREQICPPDEKTLAAAIHKTYAPFNEVCPMKETCFHSFEKKVSHFMVCQPTKKREVPDMNTDLAMKRVGYVIGTAGGIICLIFVFYGSITSVFVVCACYKVMPKSKEELNQWINRYEKSGDASSHRTPHSLRARKQRIYDPRRNVYYSPEGSGNDASSPVLSDNSEFEYEVIDVEHDISDTSSTRDSSISPSSSSSRSSSFSPSSRSSSASSSSASSRSASRSFGMRSRGRGSVPRRRGRGGRGGRVPRRGRDRGRGIRGRGRRRKKGGRRKKKKGDEVVGGEKLGEKKSEESESSTTTE